MVSRRERRLQNSSREVAKRSLPRRAGAREYVLRGSSLKVVLIDGEMLIDLMIKHGIGARVARKYEIHELDQNYFEEDK